jgi:hypothetical protein
VRWWWWRRRRRHRLAAEIDIGDGDGAGNETGREPEATVARRLLGDHLATVERDAFWRRVTVWLSAGK